MTKKKTEEKSGIDISIFRTGKMMNLLTQSIESCAKIQRKKRVLDILHKNNIFTLYDLKSNPLPNKELTENEIRQLQIMKDQMKTICGMRITQKNDLYILLGKYVSKHEQSRIYNILQSNKILNVRLLCSTSNEKLLDIHGIGPKSIKVIQLIKNNFIVKNSTSSYAYKTESSLLQPMLL